MERTVNAAEDKTTERQIDRYSAIVDGIRKKVDRANVALLDRRTGDALYPVKAIECVLGQSLREPPFFRSEIFNGGLDWNYNSQIGAFLYARGLDKVIAVLAAMHMQQVTKRAAG